VNKVFFLCLRNFFVDNFLLSFKSYSFSYDAVKQYLFNLFKDFIACWSTYNIFHFFEPSSGRFIR